MRFYLAPKGAEAEAQEAALDSGLHAHTSFNALFHWMPLSFRDSSEAYAFIVGGQPKDETIGPLLHEVTYFWQSLSPVFTAVRYLKHRALRRHYELTGNAEGFSINEDIFKNYLKWRFALGVEQLLAPIMEGLACLAEFDAPLPSLVPEAFRTPADALLLKIFKFRQASEAGSTPKPFEIVQAESFLRHFSRKSDRARRKADLYALHPLMMRQSRGAHLLGYLSFRDVYLSILSRPAEDGTDVEDAPLSLFLHAARLEFLFDETLTHAIFETVERPYASYDDVFAALAPIDRRLHAILGALIERPAPALARARRALETHGPDVGVPRLMTPDGRAASAVHTPFEAEIYEAGRQAVVALAQTTPMGIASRVAASWMRRTSLLTGTATMRLVNAPDAGDRKGRLRATSQAPGQAPFTGSADPYPLPAFDTGAEVPVSGYIGFLNGEPTFLNAFDIAGQTVLTTIGVEGEPFVMTGADAQPYGLNALEASHFHRLVADLSAIGRASPNVMALERRLDDHLSQRASNVYLDRISPVGPLGQLFMAAQSRGEDWIGPEAIRALRRPNLAYDSFAAAALTEEEWMSYILGSLSFGLGSGLRDFKVDFRETIPDDLYALHERLQDRDERSRLFVTIRDGSVRAIF